LYKHSNQHQGWTILALGELEAGPGTFLPVFLTLLNPGIARQHAGLFQGSAMLGVNLGEGLGNPVPEGFGLGRLAATLQGDYHIILTHRIREGKGLEDKSLIHDTAKIFSHGVCG
jgi:hypothetical protein